MAQPGPLLLVYDAESAPCRGVVDWVRKRDRTCLVVAFPLQNGELAQLAPELAGLPLQGEVHSLDTRTREVRHGEAMLEGLFQRLPGWRWLGPWMAIRGLASMTYGLMRRVR
jgi:predicted DCC family thiol-disulfide oxidoreductase YuxK